MKFHNDFSDLMSYHLAFSRPMVFAVLCALLSMSISPASSKEHAFLAIDHADAALQQAVEKELRRDRRFERLINRKKMGMCVLDLNGPKPRYAALNGEHMSYAASLPKIAILFAAYVSFENGSLLETPEIKKDLADMIRVSSNSAATRMIDRIGMKKIQTILQAPEYKFYDKATGGGLWVGKRFAQKGNRMGDPLFNISHGATPSQVCRFFYLLSTKQLINKHRSEQMLSDLSDPKLHHKFVSQTNILAPKAQVYRKSGSWKRWHADAIYVDGVRWRNYILVALVEDSDGERIIRQLLPAVEKVIRPKRIAATQG